MKSLTISSAILAMLPVAMLAIGTTGCAAKCRIKELPPVVKPTPVKDAPRDLKVRLDSYQIRSNFNDEALNAFALHGFRMVEVSKDQAEVVVDLDYSVGMDNVKAWIVHLTPTGKVTRTFSGKVEMWEMGGAPSDAVPNDSPHRTVVTVALVAAIADARNAGDLPRE